MNCDKCGKSATIVSGRKYHYTESGLDNVYLYNLALIVCESCPCAEPIIPKSKLLHSAIGKALALQPYPLKGSEARFLRKQHRLRAREWAALLRVDAATLSRWENDEQPIGPQSDALIRYVYFRLLEQEGQSVAGQIAERIAAATQERIEPSGVFINADNPAVYSYQCGVVAPA
jgi:DNA-binding transcriptional regulator YiaG